MNQINAGEAKRAVTRVVDMLQSVITYSMFQEGQCFSMTDCLNVLKEEKSNFPPHIYSVLYVFLTRYAVDIIPGTVPDTVEDNSIPSCVYKEVYMYWKMAEESVEKKYGYKVANLIIEETFAAIYEVYLEAVLAAW